MNSLLKINTKIKTWVILKRVMATVLAATLMLPGIKTCAIENGSNKLQPADSGYLSSTDPSCTRRLKEEDSSTSESFAQHHPLISGAMAGCGVVAVAGVIAAIKNAFSGANTSNPPSITSSFRNNTFCIDTQSVMDYITEHPDKVNALDETGTTLLCRAVCASNIELAKFLISKGANVNQLDSLRNWAPLHYAAFYGNTEMCKLLLTNNANVDIRNSVNDTPLAIVCYSGQQDDPNTSDQQRVSVAKILLHYNADIDVENQDGKTPLILATGQSGCFNIMKLLVENAQKKDLDLNKLINASDDDDGYTPLMWAAVDNNLDEFKYLLEEGADINAVDVRGFSVLMIAAETGSGEIVDYILKNPDNMDSLENIDVNFVSTTSSTALHGAVFGGNLEIVKSFLEHGANVNKLDSFGDTPLDIANNIIEDPYDEDKDTPKYEEIVKLLKGKGGKTSEELSDDDDEGSDDDSETENEGESDDDDE